MDEQHQPENGNRNDGLGGPEPAPGQLKTYPGGLVPRISPVRAAVLGLAGGFLFFQILGGLLTYLIFGSGTQGADINAMRLLQMAAQVLFILLPALIFAKVVYEDVTTVLRVRKSTWVEVGLFSSGMIVLIPLLNLFMLVQNYFIDLWAKKLPWLMQAKVLFDKVNAYVESAYGELLRINNPLDASVVILVVAVAPAVCEEVMFRGYIQKSFELRFKGLTGAVITAAFFAVYHFNPYGLAALFLLGLYFGYAARRTGSILVPILLHFINNFSAVLMLLVYGGQELDENRVPAFAEVKASAVTLAYQVILFVIVIVIIERYYKRKKEEEQKNAVLP